MKYTCIDSFSGAGGLLLGLQKAGFDSILSFDNDPLSIETQNSNHSYFHHKAIVEDVNNLTKGKILELAGLKRGELFLLSGGPPCQGFSIQRIGNDSDKRNNLILSYVNLVDELYPKFFLMENVPGIKGKRGKTLLNDALDKVEKIGYKIHMQILDAEDYGVPQRRRRVVIIGVRSDVYYKSFTFPKPSTPKEKRITVRDSISHLPCPPSDGKDHPDIKLHRKDKLSSLNIERIRALKPGQGREFLPEHLLADCHKISSSKIGHRNVYGRMPWDNVAPTITARFDSFTRGMFGHPSQDRSITLREGAILQTFPIDFNFCGNKVDIARQIGNAVPVNLATAIGKQIIKYYNNKEHERESTSDSKRVYK